MAEMSAGHPQLSVSLCPWPVFMPEEPAPNYCWQRENQLGHKQEVRTHPPVVIWEDPGENEFRGGG